MHEVIEGLWVVKVVADGIGFGDIEEEVIVNHDQSLEAFLQRCEEQLKDAKLKRRALHRVCRNIFEGTDNYR